MKKIVLIAATMVLVFASIFLNDGWIYLMSFLMALPVVVTIKANSPWALNITRWAKLNPLKTQVLITLIQLVLFLLALMAGYNFKKLGYEFSNTVPAVFAIIMVVSFLFVPFMQKKRLIVIPKEVNKQRFAFLGIALSSFILMLVYGNRIEENNSNSQLTHLVAKFDHAVFPIDDIEYADITNRQDYNDNYRSTAKNETCAPVVFASFASKEGPTASEKKASKEEKKQLKMMKRLLKHRLAFAAALSAGAVLLFILLIFTSCAGLCLLIAGIAGLGGSASTGAALGTLALGLVITGLSAFGIREIFKKNGNQ